MKKAVWDKREMIYRIGRTALAHYSLMEFVNAVLAILHWTNAHVACER
jgi:ribosomal protein S6